MLAAALTAALAAATLGAPPAEPPLVPTGTPVTASWTPAARNDWQVDNDRRPFWSVVSIRPFAPGNYDLEVYDPAGARVASAAFPGQLDDFVAIDSNGGGAPHGRTDVRVLRRTPGPGLGGAGEYVIHCANDARTVPADNVQRQLPSTAPFVVRDVWIPAGKTMTLTFGTGPSMVCPTPAPHVPLVQNFSVYLFGRGPAGPSAAYRTFGQRLAYLDHRVAGTPCKQTMTYKATVSAWYGLVVHNRGPETVTPPLAVRLS